ncbi:hypothetical protein BRADI_5g26485v3 [Brachypodium distachyon]|uniref:Uncharacterized protein n=1 Tax=Brachypodium distachyon TaxID=15368 RepID=A0A0Q3GWH0_BRADI|nr:hypothetical protein BRADI_5g26485v3 [Brachypodium distachyon]
MGGRRERRDGRQRRRARGGRKGRGGERGGGVAGVGRRWRVGEEEDSSGRREEGREELLLLREETKETERANHPIVSIIKCSQWRITEEEIARCSYVPIHTCKVAFKHKLAMAGREDAYIDIMNM